MRVALNEYFHLNTNFALLEPKHWSLPVQRKYLTQHPQTIVNLFAQSN